MGVLLVLVGLKEVVLEALEDPVPETAGELLTKVLPTAVLVEAVISSVTAQNSTATRPAPPLTDSLRAPTPTPAA